MNQYVETALAAARAAGWTGDQVRAVSNTVVRDICGVSKPWPPGWNPDYVKVRVAQILDEDARRAKLQAWKDRLETFRDEHFPNGTFEYDLQAGTITITVPGLPQLGRAR